MTHDDRFARTAVRLALAAGAALVASLMVAIPGGPARAANAVSVQIVDFTFSPGTITVQVGDTVTWTNRDSVEHTATTSAGAPQPFDTGLLGTDQSGSVTFTAAGRYDYFCIPHPTMTGTVVVEQAVIGQVPDAAVSQPLDGDRVGTYRALAALTVLTLLAAGTVLTRRRKGAG